MQAFDGLLRETMAVTAVLCLPILAVAALVGLIVAIVQAATQIQEQTLTLLPKVIAIALTIALLGPWGTRLLEHLFADAVAAIPQLVRGG
jgi:flagellar biosynthetic protein FliQ